MSRAYRDIQWLRAKIMLKWESGDTNGRKELWHSVQWKRRGISEPHWVSTQALLGPLCPKPSLECQLVLPLQPHQAQQKADRGRRSQVRWLTLAKGALRRQRKVRLLHVPWQPVFKALLWRKTGIKKRCGEGEKETREEDMEDGEKEKGWIKEKGQKGKRVKRRRRWRTQGHRKHQGELHW